MDFLTLLSNLGHVLAKLSFLTALIFPHKSLDVSSFSVLICHLFLVSQVPRMEMKLSRSTPRLCQGPTEFSPYQKQECLNASGVLSLSSTNGTQVPIELKRGISSPRAQAKIVKTLQAFPHKAFSGFTIRGTCLKWQGSVGLCAHGRWWERKHHKGPTFSHFFVPKPLHGWFNHALHKGSHLMNCVSIPYLKICSRGNHFWKMCLEQKPPTPPLPLPPLPLPKLSFSSRVLLSLPEKTHRALSDMQAVPAPAASPSLFAGVSALLWLCFSEAGTRFLNKLSCLVYGHAYLWIGILFRSVQGGQTAEEAVTGCKNLKASLRKTH